MRFARVARVRPHGYRPLGLGRPGLTNAKGRLRLMLTILLIVLLIVLLVGAFGFTRRGRRGV
jgi:hypothetical protein